MIKKQNNDSKLGHWKSLEGEREYKNSYLRAMALLPEPQATHDIATSFGTVRVYEWSTEHTKQGIPVLLLPGRSSGTPMWFKNLPDFINERTVYSIDALGDCGMSIQKTAIKNAADQADWIEQTLDQLHLNKVHIVGHSFGGWTAANFASRYPERLATMSLLEPVFTFQWVRLSLLFRITFALLPFWPQEWVDDTMFAIGGAKKGEIDRDDPVYKMIIDGVKHFKPNVPQPVMPSVKQIRNWSMPVYVAFAENSAIHNSNRAYAKAKVNVKDLRGRVWPHTTHSLPMEIPSQIDAELIGFWHAQTA